MSRVIVRQLSGSMRIRLPPQDPQVQALVQLPEVELRERVSSVVENAQAPPLYTRHWRSLASPRDGQTFRVMQFNILAEGLSASPNGSPPFNEDMEGEPISTSAYGGFDYDEVNGGLALDYHGYRKWRLLEEILRVDPDVVALEEIDHFPDFFGPLLASLGYQGVFQPKKTSPCTYFGYYSDGVAFFWKETVFDDTDLSPALFNEQCPCVILPLRHLSTGKVIVFGGTHLKAKPSEENEMRRLGQISSVLDVMSDKASECATESLILMGDFNTDAFSISSQEAKTIPFVMNWNDSCLSHAYPLPTDETCEEYSSWKSRSGKSSKHWIDYIFYTHQSLQISGLLGPPSLEEISSSPYKLPNLSYPSDHISISADITIRRADE